MTLQQPHRGEATSLPSTAQGRVSSRRCATAGAGPSELEPHPASPRQHPPSACPVAAAQMSPKPPPQEGSQRPCLLPWGWWGHRLILGRTPGAGTQSPSHRQTAPRSPPGQQDSGSCPPSSSRLCLLGLGLLVASSILDSRITSMCLLVARPAVPPSSLGSSGTPRASGPGSFLPFELQRGLPIFQGWGRNGGLTPYL